MKQATNIKDYVADLALPGMTTSTTPDDWRINKQFQMMKFRRPALGSVRTDSDR
jgi:branched-chain amino acid transport system substrate-binding protein